MELVTQRKADTGSAPAFRVLVLGPFALYEDDRPLHPGTWAPRAQTLFKLVVTAPDHRRSRDEIVDTLWPEASPEAGAANLRYTLHLLRRMFGGRDPSPILSEKHLIALNPTFTWEVDLDQFEDLVRTAGDDTRALKHAAELYRGEPLIEDRYADWAMPVQDRIQRTWRSVCLRLASRYRAGGAPQEAIDWYERILQSDPLDEQAMVELLNALLALNRYTDALRHYRKFVQRLDEELGVPPGPEILTLGQRLTQQPAHPGSLEHRHPGDAATRAVPVVPSYPLPVTGTLIGRATELSTILTALPHGGSEEGLSMPLMLLVGAEAGMGKTRLLADVAQRARERGVLTLAGGCYEQEGGLPYGPIHDALLDYIDAQPEAVLRDRLDAVLPELVRIIPEIRGQFDVAEKVGIDPESHRLHLFSSVALALNRLTIDAPLLILLDDLHWVDDGTLQLLHFLLRQSRLERVVIVGAYRIEEVASQTSLDGFLTEIQMARRAKLIQLQPLREEELAPVLEEQLGGACARSLAEVLHQRSSGNPFFALQMLQLLRQEDRLEQSEDGWRLVAGAEVAPPPAVRETVARRLRRLQPDERESLALGAVLGREFGYAPLEALWRGDERSLFKSLDAAVGANLLHETESGYAFAHPLLWEVTYRRIPAPRRALLHEWAGLKLEELYGDAVSSHATELAHHFLSAGRVHLDRVARYLVVAGDTAMVAFAWGDALTDYTRALDFTRDERITAGLQEKRGQVLKALARYDDALDALEEAIRMYRVMDDLEGEGRATALIALVHHFRQSWTEGALRVAPVVERLEQREASTRTLALLYAALPRVFCRSGREREGLEAAERAVALARDVEDPVLLAEALFVRGRALSEAGRPEDAVTDLEAAGRIAETIGDLFIMTASLDFTADAFLQRGKLLQAAEHFERALIVAERRAGLEHLESELLSLGDVHFFLGKWQRAREYVRRGFALPEQRSLPWTTEALVLQATLSLCEGDWTRARADIRGWHAVAEGARTTIRHWRAMALLAEMDLLEGKPENALVQLEPFAGNPLAVSDSRFLIPLAWAYVDAGDVKAANDCLAKAEEAAGKRRTYVPDVLRIKGKLLAQRGSWNKAHDAFNRAVSEAQGMPYPYSEARALYEHGMMQMRKGNLPEARRKLEQALAIFEQLGARPYVERTERALNGLALRR